MRRVNSQVDGQVGDALIGACHAVRLIFDLLADFEEVHKLLPLAVEELAVLVRPVDKLKDQGPSSDNAISSGQKIPEKCIILVARNDLQ